MLFDVGIFYLNWKAPKNTVSVTWFDNITFYVSLLEPDEYNKYIFQDVIFFACLPSFCYAGSFQTVQQMRILIRMLLDEVNS